MLHYPTTSQKLRTDAD